METKQRIVIAGAALVLLAAGVALYRAGILLPQQEPTPSEQKTFRNVFADGTEAPLVRPERVRIFSPNRAEGVLGEVEMEGYIATAPSRDPETGAVSVGISFTSPAGTSVPATVVLGTEEEQILSFLVPGGAIGTEVWQFRPVSDLVPQLKEGNPIVVRLFLDTPSPEEIGEGCDTACRAFLDTVVSAFAENAQLANAVRAGTTPETPLVGRAVAGLMIYTEDI